MYKVTPNGQNSRVGKQLLFISWFEIFKCYAFSRKVVMVSLDREITKRKILALPPSLTEGKTLSGDRFLLELDYIFLRSP